MKLKIKYDIQKYSGSEYEALITHTVTTLMACDFVIAIYQFGNIRCPGISDIDLLILVDNDDDFEHKQNIINEILQTSEISRYCFFHEPIIMLPEYIPYLNIFHTANDLKFLSGTPVDFKQQPPEHEQLLMWNSYFIISFLNVLHTKKPVSLRYLLLLINNIAYTIQNNDILLNTNFYPDFKKRVDEVRMYYLEHTGVDEKINTLLINGFELLKTQEMLRVSRSSRISFDFKKKIIFVTSNYPTMMNFFFFKIISFPADYFIAQDKYIETVKKLLHKDNKDTRDFFKIRDRFQSVSFLDF
jgi:hypothetical protein